MMTPERWQQVKELLGQALEMDPTLRPTYLDQACGSDLPLRDEIQRLLAAEEKAGKGFLSKPAPLEGLHGDLPEETDRRIGQVLGSYKVVSVIGEGGMGAVYRGVRADDQYQSQVAIKLVHAGQDSPLVISRFKNERQILASLDHPNIARLHDGGTTREGVPYFVMDLIEGEPIDEYCDHNKLSIDARLKLFLEVSSAVQYAHQRLIVHRDIKPSNILVTREGVPKLLDFGIAKIVDPRMVDDVSQTAMSLRILTPAYASPEQVKGEPITTASDVYSLGVVLYELLTGHHPYPVSSRTPEALSRAVCEHEPEKPSTAVRRTESASRDRLQNVTPEAVSAAREYSPDKLSKRLSGDLDKIVLMALRKEPERRYGSVEQFAEDIRRHLGQRPVSAHGDALGYRAGKFVNRHRAGIAAAAVASLALLAGTVVSLREARIARAERARAERRFNDVRKLANSLIFEIHDSVKKLPGSTAPRKLIVDRALEYLDSLAKESSSDVALQRELATAYLRVGNVQGGNNVEYLGDTAGALQSYRKALEIRKAVYAAEPGHLQNAVELSESYRSLAAALVESGQSKEALEKAQLARQLAEQSAPSHPEDVALLRELASDYEIEAEITGGDFNSADMGDQTHALETRRKELEVSERLAKLRPDDPSIQSYVAVSVVQMGDQLLLGGQWRESKDYYLRAKAEFERLAAQSPSDRAMVDYVQAMYQRLHFLEMQNGNVAQAAIMARKAIELAIKLSKTDPNDVSAKANLGEDYANLAAALCKMPGKTEAFSAIENALALMSEAAKSDPANKELLGARAAALTTAGEVYRSSHNYSLALSYYQQAAAIRERMQAEDPSDAASRVRLAATYNREASTRLLSGDAEAAMRLYANSLTITEAVERGQPHNEQALYTRADSYSGLGDVELILASQRAQADQQLSHRKRACASYQASLKMWDAVREPGNLSPDGFECTPPAVVSASLKKCQVPIASGRNP